MDEVLMRKLVRRLAWLNGLVAFFGLLFLAALIVAAFLLWRAVTYIHSGEQKITDLQTKTSQTLDVQNQACTDPSLKALLQRAGYC